VENSPIKRRLAEALGIKKKKKHKRGKRVNPADVIRKVVNKVRGGESQLKHVLERGYNINHVIWAIKNRRCIANLGSTYLEQTISGTIQDLIKDGKLSGHMLNHYRQIFGLPPMSHKNDKSQRPKGSIPPKAAKSVLRKLNKALRR
jgi:transcriptional regulator with PAS, ATPase and Fis domain